MHAYVTWTYDKEKGEWTNAIVYHFSKKTYYKARYKKALQRSVNRYFKDMHGDPWSYFDCREEVKTNKVGEANG